MTSTRRALGLALMGCTFLLGGCGLAGLAGGTGTNADLAAKQAREGVATEQRVRDQLQQVQQVETQHRAQGEQEAQ